MDKIIFNGPINSLSMGNVSVNLLFQLWLKRHKIETIFFPMGNELKFDAFQDFPQEFKEWVVEIANQRFLKIKKDIPTLKIWHILGSEQKYTNQQFLYTFYELNRPTVHELNLIDLQEETIFSSKTASEHFNKNGCETKNVPLGFDPFFKQTNKKYLGNNVVHFGLMGKWEKRKHTAEIIKLWLEKYGNKPNYMLSCCVNNPFYKEEQMEGVIWNTLGGKKYSNINFIPYLNTNAEVNDFLNAIDIDLTGLSGGEGWNLPAFNATALGKWSIVLKHTGHLDWANEENSILLDPNGMMPSEDKIFFQNGNIINQGEFFTFDRDTVLEAFEKAEKKAKIQNENGLKLQNDFTYEKTLDQILNIMQEKCN